MSASYRKIEPLPLKMPREFDGVLMRPCRWCDQPLPLKKDGTIHWSRQWHRECADAYLAARDIHHPSMGTGGVFRRDHGVCADCGVATAPGTWHADHIVPLIDGGARTLDNLQTLCKPCHTAKTKREAKERALRRRVLKEASSGQLAMGFWAASINPFKETHG
ncbi:MAG: HNH endonuclease [Candidatus Dormibacteria bacterium]